MTKKKNKYPVWTCHDCAIKAGGVLWPEGRLSTCHRGHCGVCEKIKTIASPRDYRYPNFMKGEFKDDKPIV